MKILVLGSSGMAGHVITTHFEEKGHEVTNLAGKNTVNENTLSMDVMDRSFDEFLNKNQFDVIINCIGILIKLSEERKDLAAYLNAYLPHYLENKFKGTKTRIIHMSTDCVFSGENPPYREDSPYDGQTFYDRSKALGEIINDKDLTFRMSIVGPDMTTEGVGLFNWFMAQEGTISGFTKAFWTGVTTVELAKGMEAAIEQNLTGLYNFVPNHNISKFELLSLFNKSFNKNLKIEPKEDFAVDKSLVNSRSDFNYKIPDYEDMIAEMKEWVESHKELYPHY